MNYKWINSETLGKKKPFLWFYDGEKIIIERKFKNNPRYQNIFLNSEIDKIIEYISKNDEVPLANNVEKVVNGEEKEGIGKYIYDNISKDTSAQQCSSQLVAIFYDTNIILYNNKKRNIQFRINNKNWKETLINYI